MKKASISRYILAIFLAVFLSACISIFNISTAAEINKDGIEEPTLYFTFEGKLYGFNVLYPDSAINNIAIVKVCKCKENVHLEFVSDLMDSQKMSTNTIKSVRDYLLGRTPEVNISEDLNGNQIVNIYDLILAKNMYLSNPVNYIETDGKYMPIADFIDLLIYNSDKEEFTVKFGDKVPVETTVPKVTTISKLITTTPKVTTTQKIITTPVVTTTPKVTTIPVVTTSTVVTMPLEKQMINQVLEEMNNNSDKIPSVNVENDHQQNNVLYFTSGKKVYAYTLGSKIEQKNPLIIDDSNISSMHIWAYNGNEKSFDLTSQLPDTTEKKFMHKGVEYEYELKPYSKINQSTIITVAKYIAGVKKTSLASAAFDIMQFDYNLSGTLDKEDLKCIIKAYSANPNNFLNLADDELFERYSGCMNQLEHENVLLRLLDNDDIIENYAYVVPCMDYNNSYTGKTWICPMQVLPKEMANNLLDEGYKEWETTDAQRDFILWRPLIFGHPDNAQWSSASLIMDHWMLCNYYVQPLDLTGKPIQKWIK